MQNSAYPWNCETLPHVKLTWDLVTWVSKSSLMSNVKYPKELKPSNPRCNEIMRFSVDDFLSFPRLSWQDLAFFWASTVDTAAMLMQRVTFALVREAKATKYLSWHVHVLEQNRAAFRKMKAWLDYA